MPENASYTSHAKTLADVEEDFEVRMKFVPDNVGVTKEVVGRGSMHVSIQDYDFGDWCRFSIMAMRIQNAFYVEVTMQEGVETLFEFVMECAKLLPGNAGHKAREERLVRRERIWGIVKGDFPVQKHDLCSQCLNSTPNCACMDAEFNELKKYVLKAIALPHPPKEINGTNTHEQAVMVLTYLVDFGKRDRARIQRMNFPESFVGIRCHWSLKLQKGLRELEAVLATP